ncbi:P-loop containing nucleoside triphosphate hydrolase protein [Usnea florida]
MVTRRVNPVFTGREEEIEDLKHSLCPSQATELLATWPKIYVIHGLGGAGKSEVALKFAYDNRAEFWGVFWLDASSESSLTRGFIEIAEVCGVRDKSFEGAKLWLQETPHSWLLALDNADDPRIDYAFYLPAGSKGHVLITSRVPETADLQTAGMDFYESLSETTAVELLLKTSKIDLNVYNTHRVDARNIVNLLGCHALAIVQAGASIRQGICDLREYEEMFKSQREQLLRVHPAMAKSQYGDVYATFEVSATYLRSRGDQPAKDALKLLNFHAFLNFTSFSETTFEEAWLTSRDIPRDLQPGVHTHVTDLSHWHVRHLPSFMRQGPSGQLNKISFRRARSLLASLSIVVVDLPRRMTRMHPVTHMWARDRLHNQQELIEAWLGTLAVLCLSIKIATKHKASWVQLQPHIESITDFIPDECLHHATLELHQCFYRLSYVLHEMRADKSLIEMLQKCFINPDQWWTGFGHYFQHLYGSSLIDYGDFEHAKQWLEQVVRRRETTSDPAEPSLLGCKHELARAYLAVGDPYKAKDQFLELVRIDQYLLTSDNPARLASEHELGAVYLVLKENEKAKELLEHVVDMQKSLSPEHPNRLASEHKLAGIYLACKENERAKDLLEQVVRVREMILSPEHTDRLDSERDLARVYLNLGNIAKAKNMLEKVVEIQAETLKPDHPLHLATKYTLARAYIASGERIKAQTQLEGIVQITGTLSGPRYPEGIAAGSLVEHYEECLKSDVMDYEDSIQLPTTFRSNKSISRT